MRGKEETKKKERKTEREKARQRNEDKLDKRGKIFHPI